MDRCIHGIKIYHRPDGSMIVTCGHCSEEYQAALNQRKPRKMLVGDPADRDTLRWLSGNCTVHASVPLWSEKEFVDNYTAIKGYAPEFGEYVTRHGAKTKEAKNWYDMSITFPAGNENLVFNDALNVKTAGNTTRIYSNDLVWKLLELGFDFGKHHKYNVV